MTRPIARALRDDEDGMGLVEIMVAFLLLAIIAVSFLPVLIQGLQQSAINATRAAAIQLVNEQLELANATAATCANLALLGTVPVADYIDSRGITLEVTRTISACPGTYPGTMELEVSVDRADTGETLSEASTFIYVEAAA